MNLPYRQADAMTKSHRCRCGGELVVCPDPEHHGKLFLVRCGKCRATDEEAFEAIKSYYRQWKEGTLENPYIISRLKRQEEIEMTQEIAKRTDPQQAQALMQYRNLPVLSEDQATQILNLLWPKAPDPVKAHALMLCTQLGLNPLRKHIYIIPFYNSETKQTDHQIIMSIEANRELGRRTGWYSYADGPRLMTEKEELMYFGESNNAYWRAITILTDRLNGRYVGVAEIKREAKIQGTDKGNSAMHMAQIRSERQALAKLPGDQYADLLQGVEVIDAQYIETPSGPVDTATGEIIEGKAEPVEEEPLFPDESISPSIPPPNLASAEQKDNLEKLADVKAAV